MVSEHAHLCAREERWPRTCMLFPKNKSKSIQNPDAEEKEAVIHQATNFRDQACLDLCTAVVTITTA